MNPLYLTVVNLFLCIGWGYGAFMRLRACYSGVVVRVRMIYAGMVVASVASGLQRQLFGEYAGWADLTVSATMVMFIVLGSKRWKCGVPADLMKRSPLF